MSSSMVASATTSRKKNKKAIRFSIMVAGQAGLGKTTLLATLFDSYLQPPIADLSEGSQAVIFKKTKEITDYNFELETESGARLIINAIDTPGYGDEIAPKSQADRLLQHLEGTFDEVFEEEQRIHRNPKFEEHRIHALLYLLEPTSLGLKQFDIDFMKRLAPRVNIIPVIAKADGMNEVEKQVAKKMISDDIAKHDIKVYDFTSIAEAEGLGAEVLDQLRPFAVIGATFPHAEKRRGRQYLWGFVDVDDSKHCDLKILQKILLSTARDDLKEHTEDSLYETYRTEKLLSLNKATTD